MLPTCTWNTLCAFFLLAFGAALRWGFGSFIVVQITRAIAGAVY